MGTKKQPTRSYPLKAMRIAAETRRYEMLELVKAGYTERQIAERMGVARSLVHVDIKRVLGELARLSTHTADNVRSVQMERYTALLAKWWPLALEGDEAATVMALKIMSRIDAVNGIIPDRPLIDMSVTQTIQVGEGMGLMELARHIANGNGYNGTGGISPEDSGQPHALPNGRAGGETVPEAD